MPPLIAESEDSSIHLSWVNPARPNGHIQGFVLEYLVIDNTEAHERGSVEAQDIWRECVCIEVQESEHYLYHLRPATTVWARVAAVNAKGQSAVSASAIFSPPKNEPMELMQMCVPEEHAHEATMQHRDMLIEIVPESILPDNQMPTPVTAVVQYSL